MPWWMLLLNCSMAFAFNLATMLFISRMSALHYMVAAYSKDALVVFGGVYFLGEKVSGTLTH